MLCLDREACLCRGDLVSTLAVSYDSMIVDFDGSIWKVECNVRNMRFCGAG